MKVVLCAALALSVAAVSPGAARTMQAVYTGTILSGYDTEATFGLEGSDLAGQAFTATYIYETSSPARVTGPYVDYIESGTTRGTTANVTSVTLLVNGHSYSFAPTTFAASYVDGFKLVGGNPVFHTSYYEIGQSYSSDGVTALAANLFNVLDTDQLNPVDLEAEASATIGTYNTTNFSVSALSVASGAQVVNFGGTFLTQAVQVSAVPLPATGALALVGLMGFGSLRRKRA